MKLLLNQLLPEQTGNSGKVLGTDGDNPSWVAGGGGGSLSDGDYGDVTVSSSGTVITVDKQMSITSDVSGLKLSGDATSPGNSMLYGTNGSGVKGWYAQPSGSAFTLTTVEVDIGSTPKRSGKFNISGVGLTSGKPVQISQANGPYTGKGTRSDEAEMDGLTVSGKTTSTTTIECFWASASPVKGNFKFDYVVSA